MEDEKKMDEIQDEAVSEEAVEEHAEGDAPKWDKVFGAIEDLTSRLDSFEKWVNEAIGGVDKTEADEAEDTAAETGDYEEDEVADLDKSFYDRQKKYLAEGGY